MYRVSPLTYIVGGIAATGMHGRQVDCTQDEINSMDPPNGQTCGQYLEQYMSQATGQLYNPNATQNCQYCPLTNADQFLSSVGISWSQRWENFGIVWSFVGFNILATFGLYYAFRERIRRGSRLIDRLHNILKHIW